MKAIRFASTVFALIAALVLAATAAADSPTTYYVDATTGNNSNDCLAVETACLTIQAAIDLAVDGDIVSVAAGTYDISAGLTINKALTLSGAMSGVAGTDESRGTGETILNGPTNQVAAGFSIGTTNAVVLDGFSFTGAKILAGQPANGDLSFVNNIFDLDAMTANNQTNMIFSNPNKITLTDNLFTTSGCNPTNSAVMQVAGNYAGSPDTTNYMDITGNTFIGTDPCAVPSGGNGQSTLQINLSGVQGVVQDNTFDGVDIGVLVANGTGDLTIDGNTFENITRGATEIGNGSYGAGILIFTPAFTGPITISDNTFANSDTGIRSSNAGGTLVGATVNVTGNTFTTNLYSIVNKVAGTLSLGDTNIFDGVTLSAATTDQRHAIADDIVDAIDVASYGLVRLTADTIYVTANSFFTPGGTTAATIQRGIDAAAAGDTVFVGAGTYAENVLVNKVITLDGAGSDSSPASNTVISGSGSGLGLQLSAGTDATHRVIVKDVHVTGFVSGIAPSSYNTLENVTSVSNSQNGMAPNSLNDLVITGSKFNSNTNAGIRIGTAVNFNNVTITNSEFNSNTGFGWVAFQVEPGSPIPTPTTPVSNISNLNISYTTFNDNLNKGFYTEKLADAVFDHITVNNSGTGGATNHRAGIDINLKFGAYSNIQILNSTISNNGTGDPNGGGILIKARSTGSYAASPATLNNVTLTSLTVTGNGNGTYSAGIRIGESNNSFTGTDAGPTGVVISGSVFDGNAAHAVRNATAATTVTAENNYWDALSGPSGAGSGTGEAVTAGVDFTPWCSDNTCTSFVPPFTTTTSVVSSANPSTFLQEVTFTATVSSGVGTPTGDVEFTIDGGSPVTKTLVAGEATLETSALSVGSHTVSVEYLGDSTYSGSTGALTPNQVVNAAPAVRSDFDGDGKTDAAKFMADPGVVWWYKSSTSSWDGLYLGSDTYDYVLGSDFDGDGITDPAKFYATTGVVWWHKSTTSSWDGLYLGNDSYQFISGSDFDGDGKTDPAKLYATTGVLWWFSSVTSSWDGVYMGTDAYTYQTGSDFDGDGTTDPAKFYSGTNTVWWYASTTSTWESFYLDTGTFTYVTGSDFDGDGETDPAKFMPNGVVWWYASTTSTWEALYLGSDSFEYIMGVDFDGDGKTDPAKFYSNPGTVWWYPSNGGGWDGAYLGNDATSFAAGIK